MYLKNDKIVVSIENIVMRSGQLGLSKEFILDPNAIAGWDDGTNARRDNTTRLNAAGDFYEVSKPSARLITLSGTAIAGSRQLLQEMRDEFIGLMVDGGYSELWVETTASARSAMVGLESTPSWSQQGDLFATWQITLYAPDPYLYGEQKTVQTGAGVSTGGLIYPITYPIDFNLTGPDKAQILENRGNAPSWPVFKIVGDFYTGFDLTDNLGHTIGYDGMTTFADPVVIDMARGIALQGGVDRTTSITQRDWFFIPAHGAISPSFMPRQNGSGWCDIIYRDTWI